MVEKLYDKGYNIMDLFEYVEKSKFSNETNKYKILLYFDKIRKEFRNEKNIMLLFFNFLFMRNNDNLENLSVI